MSAALYGGDIWDSIANGAVQGAISGFVLGVAIYAVCSIVNSVAQVVRAANTTREAAKIAKSYRVFWSGGGPEGPARVAAETFAKKTGRTTLEM